MTLASTAAAVQRARAELREGADGVKIFGQIIQIR
jgi:hypothetical protein